MRNILFIISLFICSSVLSQGTDKVFEFLNLPVSTRAEALGGDNVSVGDNDLSLVFHNPALLRQEMDMNVNLGFNSYLGDIKAGNVAFSKAWGDYNTWGVGVNFVDYGKFQETTIDNVSMGEISAKDICVNAFFSRYLSDTWTGGVAAKFIYSAFDQYTSLGLAVDVGLNYYHVDNDLSFGIAGKNLGAQVKPYNDDYAPIPWDIQMGITKRLAHAPIRFSITALHLTQWEFDSITEGDTKEDSFFNTFFKHLIFGAEFLPTDNVWVALGYNPKVGSDLSIETGNRLGGFSIGGGIRVKAFNLGVSVGQFHPSATSFHLNVTTSLNDFKL